MPDDVPAPAAHGLRGFHQAMVDFAQAHFGNACKEGCGGDGQRHHGRPHAVGSTDQQAGERYQRDHQDQKGDRAEQVDERAQHPVKQARLEYPAFVAGDQQHRHRYPDQQGDQRRHADHQQGIEQAFKQAIKPHGPIPPRLRPNGGRAPATGGFRVASAAPTGSTARAHAHRWFQHPLAAGVHARPGR
ncbi:hypothetical protein D3C76_1012950 [compost metagenome]